MFLGLISIIMSKKPHITHYKAMYEKLIVKYDDSQKELVKLNADNIKVNYKLHTIFRKVGRIHRVS